MNNISYSQMRILETAECFKRLNIIFNECGNEQNAMGAQLKETARLLEEASGINLRDWDPEAKTEKKLKKKLASGGIKLSSIMIFKKEEGRIGIFVTARTIKHECIKAVCLAKVLSDFFGKDIVPARGSRMVITQTEEEFVFEEAARFFSLFGSSFVSKNKDRVSGDSFTFLNDYDGKSIVALADGMGTGEKAGRTSNAVIELLESFAETGFSQEAAVSLINAAYAAKSEENPVTLDCVDVSLLTGKCTIVKLGAAASYIKSRESVRVIQPSSLPAGMLEDVKPDITTFEMKHGEYIILVSDGIADALPFFDKESYLARIIDEIPAGNPKNMAEQIMDEVLLYLGDEYKDDMTVLVLGIWEQ